MVVHLGSFAVTKSIPVKCRRSNYSSHTSSHTVTHFFCSLIYHIYLLQLMVGGPWVQDQTSLKYLLYKYTFQNIAVINDGVPEILTTYIIIELISILYNSNSN